MMEYLQTLTLIALSVIICSDGQSIRKIIDDTQDLTKLEQYIRMTNIYVDFDKDGKYTYFAPNDHAFGNVSSILLHDFGANSQRARNDFNDLMSFHTTFEEYKIDVLSQTESLPSLSSGEPKLFIYKHATTSDLFVNGAKIVLADQPATNGVVHIVDRVLYPVGSSQNAWAYVEGLKQNTDMDKRTGKFFELLAAYKEKFGTSSKAYRYLNSGSKRVTLFVPPDSVFQRNELAKRFKQLKDSELYLRQMVEAHIMPDAVMHTGVLMQYLDQDLPGIASTFTPKYFGSEMLVSSGCVTGRLTRANLTVSNGVIHFVDTTFGFVYNDALGQIKEDDELSSFEYLAQFASGPVKDKIKIPDGFTGQVRDENKITIFAPINNAFPNSLEIKDISQNATATSLVLQMSIIAGKALQLRDLTGEHQTMRPGYKTSFIKDENGDTWVDVDHVRGRIVKSDVCVRNGVVHYVSHVLGYSFFNIELFIHNDERFSELWTNVRQVSMNGYLKSDSLKLTMFVPTNEAFSRMRESSLGRRFFDSFNKHNLRNLLFKHVLEETLFLNKQTFGERGITVDTTLSSTSITIVKRDNKYFVQYGGTEEAEILQPDLRMKNGVVHVIDRVLFSASLESGEWTAGASVIHVQFILLIGLLLIHLFVYN